MSLVEMSESIEDLQAMVRERSEDLRSRVGDARSDHGGHAALINLRQRLGGVQELLESSRTHNGGN